MSLSQSNEIAAPVADDVKAAHADAHGEAHAGAHAVPRRVLLAVYGALLVFTAITVGVSTLNLGPFNIWVALMVAVIKGGLVVMYFMHLRWDSPFNGLILVAALFFVALFIGIAMLDAHSYEVNMLPPPTVILPEASPTEGSKANPTPEDNGPVIASLLPKDVKVPTGAVRAQILDTVTAIHGDAYEGEKLFSQLACAGCHTVRKTDPLKGPYLGEIARKYTRRELAENIIDPNMKIAEGFETHHYRFSDEIPVPGAPGGTADRVDGFLVKETPDKITVRLLPPSGDYLTFNKSDVVSSKVINTSPMPEGIVNSLTLKKFASILDYLQAVAGVK